MTKNTIAIGLTLGLTWSLLTLGALPASAEKASPLHSGPNCLSQIQLPQDKEELGLSDVKHAVENHLLRIGAIGHDVWVSWFDEDEDVIAVEISFDGNLRRQIKVDAANAAIIAWMDYRKPVGFGEAKNVAAVSADNQPSPQVLYSRQLRRHMLGDGQPWANWLSDNDKGLRCMDDYKFGGPLMLKPGS